MRQKAICLILIAAMTLLSCNRGNRGNIGVITTAAALTVMQLIIPLPSQDVQAVFDLALIRLLIQVLVFHTVLTVPEKVPDLAFTEIAFMCVLVSTLTLAVLLTLFRNVQASSPQGDDEVTFPEGLGPNGLTLHATTEVPMPEGEYYIFQMTCGAAIPLSSPGNVYQYAFVMDSDGVTTNNYTTADNDFFNDTDRWYEVAYTDATGWTLTVKTAFNGAITEVASAARVIISKNAMVLVVPSSEFAIAEPSYRVTAFCHTGDFGIPEPHVWSGDLEPPVAMGLQMFTVEEGMTEIDPPSLEE